MKNALRISGLANILLAIAVLWLVERNPSKTAPPNAITGPASALAKGDSASHGPEETHYDNPREFRWSQLESTDYRIYIANLRRIGCPEQTVRDIITADVDTLYILRRTELERKEAALKSDPFSADMVARRNLEQESQRLRSEEGSLISALLDPLPASSTIGANARALRLRSQETPTPLVCQNVDLTALNLSPEQVDAIQNLRQKFQDEMGSANANPDDSAYRQRWQRAQSESDSLLLAVLGSDAFINYQMLAAGQSSPATH